MRSVKRETPDRIGAAAIVFVANDGMAAFGKMDAYLVLASGFQPDLDERGPGISLPYPNVRDSEFSRAGFASGIDTICRVLCEMGTDRELIRRYLALNDGHVSPAGAVIFEL